MRFFHLVLLGLLGLLAVGCERAGETPGAAGPEGEEAVPVTLASSVDEDYLMQDLWNDGQAEVAFYRVERDADQYGRPNPQSFLVGTYLVKHQFDPERMTKGTDGSGVPAFKYALFYELESGTYQYKRNWVVNAAQADLRPIKQSFTSFDWCSNLYRELALEPDGTVDVLVRSDDYGNRTETYPRPNRAVTPALIPVLVRALDAGAEPVEFQVATVAGDVVPATATVGTVDTLTTPAGALAAEPVRIAYNAPVPSLIAETADSVETYWRATTPDRRLVRLDAASGTYRMTLVEHLRSPYWTETIWDRLERVEERP